MSQSSLFLLRLSFFLNKSSLNCCKSLFNFQSREKIGFDNFSNFASFLLLFWKDRFLAFLEFLFWRCSTSDVFTLVSYTPPHPRPCLYFTYLETPVHSSGFSSQITSLVTTFLIFLHILQLLFGSMYFEHNSLTPLVMILYLFLHTSCQIVGYLRLLCNPQFLRVEECLEMICNC